MPTRGCRNHNLCGACASSDKVSDSIRVVLRGRRKVVQNAEKMLGLAAPQLLPNQSAVPDEYSDDSLALIFTRVYTDTLRYTAAWNKWHELDSTCRWSDDTTLHVFEKARVICREASESIKPGNLGRTIASARTVASVEKLARYDRRHAARPEQWDADPFLLCTPSGVVDLQTGERRATRPADYFTKQTAVSPGGVCFKWDEFMRWITGGDSAYIEFLQRVAGYCLTGSTREHALFFGYGTGGNGKGTWLNTIAAILADYAKVAPIDTFTEQRGERHPTELAMLRGARLVTAQETERGRRWAESRVKAMTGGDPISARFMRQDFFTFTPQFKLVIIGNYKPAIDSVDEAIRRRFYLLPFDQQISLDRRDQMLSEKLRAESPGILEWMLRGCALWLEYGLQPPERVVAATQAYLADQDSLQAWITEACVVGARYWESSARLYASWLAWAERAHEEPGSQKDFSQQLQKKGFAPEPRGHAKTRGYRGLSIRSDPASVLSKQA